VSHQEGKRTPAEARNDAVDVLVAALARTAQAAEAPQQQQQTTMPEGMQVHIEADPRMNAIIVRDLAERLPRYEQLIAALDVEPQTLEIEATIIDVNTDKARELGINWRWNNDGREASFSGSVPTIGPGGIASAVLGSAGQFLARIRALQTEGVARVVSSPQVVTLSNVEAVFDNSSTFFVRVAGREQSTCSTSAPARSCASRRMSSATATRRASSCWSMSRTARCRTARSTRFRWWTAPPSTPRP
jgi:type III secretion protein C